MTGMQSDTILDLSGHLFGGCPEVTPVARYHSLAAAADSIPNNLKVTARTVDGQIMAVQQQIYPVYGVQFHPEFKGRPNRPHPLFCGFVKAACAHQAK